MSTTRSATCSPALSLDATLKEGELELGVVLRAAARAAHASSRRSSTAGRRSPGGSSKSSSARRDSCGCGRPSRAAGLVAERARRAVAARAQGRAGARRAADHHPDARHGFRHVELVPNEGAPAGALPYTVVVNGAAPLSQRLELGAARRALRRPEAGKLAHLLELAPART